MSEPNMPGDISALIVKFQEDALACGRASGWGAAAEELKLVGRARGDDTLVNLAMDWIRRARLMLPNSGPS